MINVTTIFIKKVMKFILCINVYSPQSINSLGDDMLHKLVSILLNSTADTDIHTELKTFFCAARAIA